MFRLIRRIKSLFSVQFAWIAVHLTCYVVATPSAWSVLRGFKMDVEYVGPLLESAHDCFCNTVCAYINRRPNINRRPCLQSIIFFCFYQYMYMIVLSVWKFQNVKNVFRITYKKNVKQHFALS